MSKRNVIVLAVLLIVAAVAIGGLYRNQQRRAEADALVLRALSETSQGHAEQASELVKRIEQLQPNHPRLDEVRGEVELSQGHLAPALQHYERAVTAQPNNAGYWATQGRLLVLSERKEEGKKSLLLAVELDPHNVPARQHLAELAVAEGDRATARTLLEGLVADTTGPVREGYQRQLEALKQTQ